jgi:hypothetical protein
MLLRAFKYASIAFEYTVRVKKLVNLLQQTLSLHFLTFAQQKIEAGIYESVWQSENLKENIAQFKS